MQRDEPAPDIDPSVWDEPIGFVIDGDAAAYYLGDPRGVSREIFDAVVPDERRVVLLDTQEGTAAAYDAAHLINQMNPTRTRFTSDEAPWWLKAAPGPRLLISDDDYRRIAERARLLTAPPLGYPSAAGPAPIPEPRESIYVRDPTPACQILPPGSPYREAFDFFDIDVERDDFEREVPPARRAVLRSGTLTTAYDAAQLLRAAKGVAGNSDRLPAARAYVLSTATGSCTIDRGAYEDLVQRAVATTVDEVEQQATEEEEEWEEPEPVVPLWVPHTVQRPRELAVLPAIVTRAQTPVIPSPPSRRPMTTTVRAREAAQIYAPAARQAPRAIPAVDRFLGAGATPLGARPQQQPQPQQLSASTRTRINEAVRGAREGALVRFIASPDFAQLMQAPLAVEAFAQALADDFMGGPGAGDPLPIALTSLAVRSLGSPVLSDTADATLVSALVERDAATYLPMLQQSGFALSDDAVIRAVLTRVRGPQRDVDGAIRILDALPLRDRTNYRRVLAGAARLGSLPVVRYVSESVLRDAPITRDEATLLADVANDAGQRAIASFFLSMAEPMEPVPVSADYREREREYRGFS